MTLPLDRLILHLLVSIKFRLFMTGEHNVGLKLRRSRLFWVAGLSCSIGRTAKSLALPQEPQMSGQNHALCSCSLEGRPQSGERSRILAVPARRSLRNHPVLNLLLVVLPIEPWLCSFHSCADLPFPFIWARPRRSTLALSQITSLVGLDHL